MKYIVYQTTNKVNGKLFIGVHKTINPEIFDGYIGNGIYVGYSLANPKTVYQHALKKYGYDSFIRTTLFTYDIEENAYNKEAELVTLEFIKQENNYNTKVGGIHGGCGFKTTYQFNLKGNLIKTWSSLTEVIEFYDCNHSRITQAITNKYNTLESYWSFTDSINIEEYHNNRHSDVYQFTVDGILIAQFKSVAEACSVLNLNKNSLQDACNQQKPYKNSFWIKNPEDIYKVIKMYKLYALRNREVNMYNMEGILLQTYTSITNASDDLNIPYGTIKSAIKNNSLVRDKYYFKFASSISQTKTKVAQYNKDTGELVKIWDNITACAKEHPKCREVIKGARNQTHGYTFKYIDEEIEDIV